MKTISLITMEIDDFLKNKKIAIFFLNNQKIKKIKQTFGIEKDLVKHFLKKYF